MSPVAAIAHASTGTLSLGASPLRPELTAGSPVRSVERALTLLEVLASASSPTQLSDLARATGLAKATVHRMLGSLVVRQFAAKVGENYALGSRLFELAADAQQNPRSLQRLLMPFLLELFSRTRGAVSVGVLHNGHVLYSDSLHDQRTTPRPQSAVPAHCTALGKLLLAYQPDALAGPGDQELAKFTENTVPTVAALSHQLDEIRHRGVAYSREERIHGEVELAVPVFTIGRRVVTGLSISGAAGKLDLGAATMHARQVAHLASAHCQERTTVSFLRRLGHTRTHSQHH